MDNIKTFISQQWSLAARDWLKSLFYAVIVPILLQLQSVLDNGGFEQIDVKLFLQVALSAAVAHILRKLVEPSKEIIVKDISNEEAEALKASSSGGNNPPPSGDATHPKVPKK